MTDHRKQAFAPYVRAVADMIGLKDWRVEIVDEPSSASSVASITPWEGRKRATIRLTEEFLAECPEEQRHVVVHELIHCHTAAAWRIADESLPADVLPAFEQMMEYAVDGLADAFAPAVPLPEEYIKPRSRAKAK